MKYDIIDAPNYALLRVIFEGPGEQVITQAGAMVAMSADLDIKTAMRGGVLASAKRKMFGGESLFQNTYTSSAAGQELYVAAAAEGDLRSRSLRAGETFYLQSGAYIAQVGEGMKLDTQWGGVRSFFGGVGFFLLRITGPGTVFFGSYGALHDVTVGDTGYTADTGHIVGFTEGLSYKVRPFGGMKGLFFSGEGLVCDFSGGGTLFLQTRNPASLAAFLYPYRPVKTSRGES
jgi:uncharacterized protein (TIGR00266 family)